MFLRGCVVAVFTTLFIAGCSSKNDAISNAERMENGRPGIAETKAIAAQYKAPIGKLFNEERVFTPKDTAVITPNSDTPLLPHGGGPSR
jgi:hypothetical protein